MSQPNVIAVYSRRIALELQRKGHIVWRTVPNWKYPNFDTYLFVQTPELLKDWKELTGGAAK